MMKKNIFNLSIIRGILLTLMILSSLGGKAVFAQTTYNVTPEGVGLSSLLGAMTDIKGKTASMNADIIVSLASGTYYLPETLYFGTQDGGNGDYSVIYKAKSGAKPIISGGVKVDNWQPYPNSNSNIYRTKLTGIPYVRNLYVNDKRAKRARGAVKTGQSLYIENGEKKGLIFNKTDINQYANASNVEINYLHRWRDYYFLIESIEDGATLPNVGNNKYLVRIKNFNWYYTAAYSIISPGAIGPMNKFYFENAYELLDEPGEFYFNTSENMLYYYPLPGQDMNSVETIVPKIEHLVKIKSGTVSNQVKNLRFEGIEFAHTTWDYPSINGFGVSQSSSVVAGNDAAVMKMPAGFHIENAKNITIKDNIFTHMGSSGIDLHNNTDRVFIKSNTFLDISGVGITAADARHKEIDLPDEGLVKNTLVSNNYIENIGAEFASSVAIEALYVDNMHIDHNEVFNVPYTGIAIGWGWSIEETTSASNSVTNNYISGVVQKCHDGGSIYTLSKFVGSGLLISGNFIDELSLPPATSTEGAIYTDEQSSNVVIKNNVVKSTRRWFYYNWAGTVSVNSMYVSSSVSNWGGNNGSHHNVTLNQGQVWQIPHATADIIEKNAGIQEDQGPPYYRGLNVALNKPSFSSSEGFGKKTKEANDGLELSIWSPIYPTSIPDWWYVDLRERHSIDRIELVTRQVGVSYPGNRRNFVIDASNDSSFPTNDTEILHTQTTDFGARATLVVNSPTTNTYRYIRVRKINSTESIIIAELKVFGTKNIALNKLSFSSSEGFGRKLYEANDGSELSIWSPTYPTSIPDWWYVDLRGRYSIDRIELVTRQVGVSYPGNRRNFVIEASNSPRFLTNDTEILHTQTTDLGARATLAVNTLTTNNYRYIRVRKTNSTESLIVAELRAFGQLIETLDNIALNKPSFASSEGFGKKAKAGNDDLNGSFWHPVYPSPSPAWWYVDLNGLYTINNIELVTRQVGISYANGRRNFVIEASNNPSFPANSTDILHTQTSEIEDRAILVVNLFTTNNAYRFIRVRKTVSTEALVIGELRVFGKLLENAYDNIALNKPSFASSEGFGTKAKAGNDDSAESFWHPVYPSPSPAWWYVNLSGSYTVNRIELVTRQVGISYPNGRKNFVIEASNSSSFPANSTDILHTQTSEIEDRVTLVVNTTTTNAYSFIRVRKTVSTEALVIGELRVFGENQMQMLKNASASTSAQKMLKINQKNGIDEKINHAIRLYPNPIQETLKISLNSNIKDRIFLKIMSLDGEIMYTNEYNIVSGANIISVNLSKLPSAYYIVHITGKEVQLTKRVIKTD